jgi:hypothetical protein
VQIVEAVTGKGDIGHVEGFGAAFVGASGFDGHGCFARGRGRLLGKVWEAVAHKGRVDVHGRLGRVVVVEALCTGSEVGQLQ